MHEDYTLLTPENVELRYPVAGVGSRVVAATIDYTILVIGQLLVLFGLALAGALISRLFGITGDQPSLSVALSLGAVGLAIILIFFGWWGYFVLFELLWNGQSPGKKLLGIRVVRLDGQALDAGTSIVRNLLRAVDIFLSIGVLVMLLDSSSRRLGDLAAGSLVVREARGLAPDELSAVEIPDVPSPRVEAFSNPGRLTMQHYILVRDYFARRTRMPDDRADALAVDLAKRLARAVDIPLGEVGDANDFLAAAARAFEGRHRHRE